MLTFLFDIEKTQTLLKWRRSAITFKLEQACATVETTVTESSFPMKVKKQRHTNTPTDH